MIMTCAKRVNGTVRWIAKNQSHLPVRSQTNSCLIQQQTNSLSTSLDVYVDHAPGSSARWVVGTRTRSCTRARERYYARAFRAQLRMRAVLRLIKTLLSW